MFDFNKYITNNQIKILCSKFLLLLQKLCQGENLFIQRPCHSVSAAHSLELLRNAQKLCNGSRYFKAGYKGFGLPRHAANFIKFVKSLYGMENSLIILGVGK